MSNIVSRQVYQHLEIQNLSLRAITRLLVFSVLGLLLVIALLLLSLSAFASAPSILLCIVGSFGVIGAAVIVHRLSVARFRIDDSSLNGMAAASIVSIKKSLDFVLRQMSQAARLLKAMEGNGSSAVADDADGSSSIDRRKTYKQAAQMAIMHDAAARTDRRPLAPPTTRPTPRLWRQRPITRPSMSAPMRFLRMCSSKFMLQFLLCKPRHAGLECVRLEPEFLKDRFASAFAPLVRSLRSCLPRVHRLLPKCCLETVRS
jgi:hypothetical protein